jgi:hypothetical protein
MSRFRICSFALLTIASMLTARASAVVIEVPVTPASVKEVGSRFSITAENRDDGLIHFTITYRLIAPQYLVAHVEVRDGKTLIVTSDTPSFVREKSATYYVAVSPKHLADSKFDLAERSFGDSAGTPVPMPGGTDYQIRLAEFGQDAPAAKEK